MKIDGNNRYVAMGVNPSGEATPLKVDTVTGYLLVSATIGSPGSGTSYPTVDTNDRGVAFATDPSGNLVTLATDNNGNLYMTTS